eukprot:2487071-Pleurochrysis_carterae.AAC.4
MANRISQHGSDWLFRDWHACKYARASELRAAPRGSSHAGPHRGDSPDRRRLHACTCTRTLRAAPVAGVVHVPLRGRFLCLLPLLRGERPLCALCSALALCWALRAHAQPERRDKRKARGALARRVEERSGRDRQVAQACRPAGQVDAQRRHRRRCSPQRQQLHAVDENVA